MSNSYLGFGKQVLTLPASGQLTVGKVVTMTKDGALHPAGDAEFIGVLDSLRGTVAGVQIEGYTECRYAGSEPAIGVGGLVADASGYVKTAASAMRKYRILKVDAARHIIGFIL